MTQRFRLIPQMEDYTRLKPEWVPHLMYNYEPNFHSVACNTDEYGFRHTYKDGQAFGFSDFIAKTGPKAIISGGSTAFGTGATHDNKTIASRLNVDSETTWLNFAGPAHTSTQELIRFILFSPKVDRVLLFSGINNLLIHTISPYFSEIYSALFGQHAFELLNRVRSSPQYLKYILKRAPGRLKQQLLGRFSSTQNLSQEIDMPDFDDRYAKSLKILTRDLDVWTNLRDGQGFQLTFVLQPQVSWMSKTLSTEEDELLRLYHKLAAGPLRFGAGWSQLDNNMSRIYPRYREDTRNLCEARGIQWLDSNELLPRDGWLFCDLIHLTDEGQNLAADLIMSNLDRNS